MQADKGGKRPNGKTRKKIANKIVKPALKGAKDKASDAGLKRSRAKAAYDTEKKKGFLSQSQSDLDTAHNNYMAAWEAKDKADSRVDELRKAYKQTKGKK